MAAPNELEPEKKLEFVEDLWVQCDAPFCRKWRRLPGGSLVGNHVRWYCRMNPDTRYNSCDIDEEFYDERNEILLTQPKTDSEKESKTRSKRRKRDTKKEPTDRHAALKAELEKRKQWCQTKLQTLAEETTQSMHWTIEDMAYLQTHAPDASALLLQSMNMCSALSYFTKEGDEERTALLESVKTAQKQFLASALKTAATDVDQMILEASNLN